MSCYLIYSGYCKSASEACRLFGNKRTMNGKGITIPRYEEQKGKRIREGKYSDIVSNHMHADCLATQILNRKEIKEGSKGIGIRESREEGAEGERRKERRIGKR